MAAHDGGAPALQAVKTHFADLTENKGFKLEGIRAIASQIGGAKALVTVQQHSTLLIEHWLLTPQQVVNLIVKYRSKNILSWLSNTDIESISTQADAFRQIQTELQQRRLAAPPRRVPRAMAQAAPEEKNTQAFLLTAHSEIFSNVAQANNTPLGTGKRQFHEIDDLATQEAPPFKVAADEDFSHHNVMMTESCEPPANLYIAFQSLFDDIPDNRLAPSDDMFDGEEPSYQFGYF